MLEAVRGSTKDGNNCVKEHQFWIRAQASAKDKDTGQGQGQGRGGGGQSVQSGRRHRSQDWHVQASNRPRGRRVRFPATANGNAGFLVAMARCPRDDAAFILSHLGRITADAGAARWAGRRRVHLGRWRFEFRPPSRRFGYPSGARGASGARGGGRFPDAFLAMRRRFAATLAASSVCGWVAGVGDRHLQNVLVDLRDRSLVHIDFGYAFGTATAILPIPRLTPFRATRARAPRAHDAIATLRGDMAKAMHALRRGSALLRGVMDVFLREPLIDWQREARLQSMKSGRAAAKRSVVRRRRRLVVIRGGPRESRGSKRGPRGGSQRRRSEGRGAEGGARAPQLELGNPCHVTLAQCAPKHEGQGALGGDARPRLRRHS